MKHAIVIGGGIGGLAGAKALTSYFEKVTVLERDALTERASPRPGTPQGRHAHLLLPGGQKALRELFPGIENDFKQAGAVVLPAGRDRRAPGGHATCLRDSGLEVWGMSRPLLESVCRRRLEKEPNVQIRSRARVIEIIASLDRPSVGGVRFEENGTTQQELTGDLVLDASGRAAPTLSFFDRISWTRPGETKIGIDLRYATMIFEVPQRNLEWGSVAHIPELPNETRGGLILPIENHKWIVSIGGWHGDDPPDDFDGFVSFAKTFRVLTIYDAIKGAKPVSAVFRYSLPASVRRHFYKLPRTPRGLIPIGDSICRFNPIYGQGMSVATQEATLIGNLLEFRRSHVDPIGGLAEQYFAAVENLLETPWATAILDFAHPQTRGERPPDLQEILRYEKALLLLAAYDPDVHKTMTEVNSLLKPQSALREPALAERIRALALLG